MADPTVVVPAQKPADALSLGLLELSHQLLRHALLRRRHAWEVFVLLRPVLHHLLTKLTLLQVQLGELLVEAVETGDIQDLAL